MLERLAMHHVGPVKQLELNLKPRLNVLTGDNGLGKTFLLEVAWWALTGAWTGEVVRPWPHPAVGALEYKRRAVDAPSGPPWVSTFDRHAEQWRTNFNGTNRARHLTFYAHVDGGVSIYDPVRGFMIERQEGLPTLGPLIFRRDDVWYGLQRDNQAVCEGLLRDWATWQRESGEPFAQLTRVLRHLSPSPDELLEPGRLKRVSVRDARDYPTLKMPYGQEVALHHASAGMQRVLGLAYMLVWAWREHQITSELIGHPPSREIVLIMDEVEAHLHPQWQRRIVPALLAVMEALTGASDIAIQLILSTHAPLVLASLEPRFDPSQDAIWELDLAADEDGQQVVVAEVPWRRRGDANAWLTSTAFDLKEARSVEAEDAITQALALLRQPDPDLSALEAVDKQLRAALGDTDRFWLRWSAFLEAQREAAL